MKPSISYNANGSVVTFTMDGPTADALARAIAYSLVEVFPELLELGRAVLSAMPPEGRELFLADSEGALDAVIDIHRQRIVEGLMEMDTPDTPPGEPGCGCGEGENK